MNLIFLGTAGGLTTDTNNYQSNMLLIADSGKKLLLDCGTDIRFALAEQQLTFQDINAVYISHLHLDHAGGLPWLGLLRKFSDNPVKPKLYIKDKLVPILWENNLLAGMQTLASEVTTLETFFDIHAIKDNEAFIWENAEFQLIQMLHIISGFVFMPCYGLFFTYNNKHIFITMDTQFIHSQLDCFYQKADLIFHDCETFGPAKKPSGVHPTYESLANLDPAIKAKMWLYHYNDGKLPDAKKDGFCGFAKKGQSFDLTAL